MDPETPPDVPVDPPSDQDQKTGFTVKKTVYPKYSMIIFTFLESFTDSEFINFLALLDKLVHSKTVFCLLIDSRKSKGIPMKASISLVSWMKKRKPDIPGVLIGSSVVMTSQIIVSLINSAFKIQRPVSPNLMTNDYEKAVKFLENIGASI
jgi:hypothetical protein